MKKSAKTKITFKFFEQLNQDDSYFIFYENDKEIIRASIQDIWGPIPRSDWSNNSWAKAVIRRIKTNGVVETRYLLTGSKKQKKIIDQKIPGSRLDSVD